MVYMVFLKKNRVDPGSASNNQIFKKKTCLSFQNIEMQHRIVPNFASSFS